MRLADERGVDVAELSLEDLRAAHAAILPEVYQFFGVDNSVASRASYGGTAPVQVLARVRRWRQALA